MTLTKHFTLEEMTHSQTAVREGIFNEPSSEIIDNLQKTAQMLERVRALLDAPILISSGYRSRELNMRVGGSKGSMHMYGLAADFTAPTFGTPYKVARFIADSTIEFDQLIHEYGRWVHIGLSLIAPKREALSIFNGTGYLKGIIESPPKKIPA